MFKKSLIPIVVATALAGCGSDDNSKLEGNSNGTIELMGSDFFAGATLSLTVSDPDGIVDDSVSYSWSQTDDSGNTTEISGATGTTYTITEADEGFVITGSAFYTDQAGFIEGLGASTTSILPTLDVTAFVVKGPVSGATCEIFSVDDSGASDSTVQASSTSDETGAVSFADVHFVGNGLISCSGGTYVDESTGETLDAPALRAVVDVIEDVADTDLTDDVDNSIVAPDYIVSPLTEMAVQAAGDDLNTASDEADTINGRFGIRFDTTETYPTTVGVDALGADGADDADRYGSVLALISQLDADDADSDLATILTELVADISDDATYSEDTLTAFETAQINLQTTSAVATDVDESLLDAIGAAVGYNNDPVAAIIEGDLVLTVNSTETDPLTASATIIDPNFEEDAFIVQTDVVLDYGTFSIAADGSWSYTVDGANETVAALEVGDSVSDSVTITSIDGTTADIAIRVAALTKMVQISDTSTSASGGIRIDIEDTRQGKLTATILKENAVGSDGNVKDAYITLFGTSGAVDLALIDLRIQGNQTIGDVAVEPRFFVRNTDNDNLKSGHSEYAGGIISADFVEDQFYEIDITWDIDQTDQITVTIDGEVMSGGAFSTAAVTDPEFVSLDDLFADGIGRIDFNFSDSSRTVPFGSYYVDNIAIYSDTAGTVSVFEDDFESYDEGETLDGDDTAYAAARDAEVVAYDPGADDSATPATILDLTGTIASDEATSTGAVSVFDPDDGEAFVVESMLTGTYGTLDISEDGSWTYTLDTANATIAALIVGERETDTFTIESVDGTMAELIVTISGTVVVNTGSDKAVRITDSSDADAGELRYKPDTPIVTGRMTATVRREAGAKAEDPSEDAQIGLFGSSTSSNNAMAYIQLDISGDDYDLRDSSGSSNGGGSTEGFEEGVDIDFEISWDASAATDTVAPLLTVTIDGQPAFDGEFSAQSADLPGLTEGLQTIFFRVGGTSDITTFGFIVDDFTVYSSDSGTEVEVFSDDFESYTVGNSLDPNADTASTAPIEDAIVEATTPYNNNSFEAFVVETGSTDTANKYAIITDSSDADAGELRYKPDTPIVTGRMTASVRREAGAKAEDPSEDAQIGLFGSSTSSNNAMAYIQLDISGDDYDLRDSSGSSNGGGSTEGFEEGVDIDFEISWDASAATDTVAPLLTVTIDGQPAFDGEFSAQSADLPGLTEGLQTIFFRVGGTSDITAFGFIVDDFTVYSSDSGTEVEVFSDDFESYTVGNSLDPNADTASTAPIEDAIVEATTPYNNNSFEVVVGEQ